MRADEQRLAGFSPVMLLFTFGWNTLVLGSHWWLAHPWNLIQILSPFAAFTLLRSLAVLRVRYRIVLDSSGLHFAWGRTIFLVPWVFREERRVPWDELLGVRLSVFSVNGMSTSTLIVSTLAGDFEVPEGFFDKTLSSVQTAILDHLEMQRRPAVVAGPEVEQLRAALFTPPLRLERGEGEEVWFAGFAFLGVSVAIFTWVNLGFDTVSIIVTGIGGVLCWAAWLFMQTAAQHKVLLLTATGFVVGPTDSASPTRWEQVRCLRKTVTNGVTEALSVLLTDGSRQVILAKYGPHLDTLAALFDPESRELASARQLLAGGASVADALSASKLASHVETCRRFDR